jgi:hypothetical protein
MPPREARSAGLGAFGILSGNAGDQIVRRILEQPDAGTFGVKCRLRGVAGPMALGRRRDQRHRV